MALKPKAIFCLFLLILLIIGVSPAKPKRKVKSGNNVNSPGTSPLGSKADSPTKITAKSEPLSQDPPLLQGASVIETQPKDLDPKIETNFNDQSLDPPIPSPKKDEGSTNQGDESQREWIPVTKPPKRGRSQSPNGPIEPRVNQNPAGPKKGQGQSPQSRQGSPSPPKIPKKNTKSLSIDELKAEIQEVKCEVKPQARSPPRSHSRSKRGIYDAEYRDPTTRTRRNSLEYEFFELAFTLIDDFSGSKSALLTNFQTVYTTASMDHNYSGVILWNKVIPILENSGRGPNKSNYYFDALKLTFDKLTSIRNKIRKVDAYELILLMRKVMAERFRQMNSWGRGGGDKGHQATLRQWGELERKFSRHFGFETFVC